MQDPRQDRAQLDEVVELMAETLCSRKKTIVIAGDEYPAEMVKEKLLRITSSHIEYVFDCLKQNTTYVRNIKKYLLASLFNAPSTMGSYYSALVNRWRQQAGNKDRRSCPPTFSKTTPEHNECHNYPPGFHNVGEVILRQRRKLDLGLTPALHRPFSVSRHLLFWAVTVFSFVMTMPQGGQYILQAERRKEKNL